MRVTFILGKWSSGMHGQLAPLDLYRRRALTGSESSFFNLARALSSFGHEVNVFCDTPVEAKGFAGLDGANVYSLGRDLPVTSDAYISLNEPDQLKRAPKDKLRVCWQQLGDFPGFISSDFDLTVDKYVALSPVHKQYIQTSSAALGKGTDPAKWAWLPNSTNMDLYDGVSPGPREQGKMVWLSSPDRGLHRLLEIFPEIRRRVPYASLDIYYRFDPWYEMVKDLQGAIGDRGRYIFECLHRMGRNGENGVRVVGATPNVELSRRLRQAWLLPYTCDCLRFTESFSVSILDACAAGLPVIISDEDAIAQIYESVALVIPGKPGRSREQWTAEICRMLLPDWKEQWQADSEHAIAFAKRFDRLRVGALWERFLSSGGKNDGLPADIKEFTETEYRARGPAVPELTSTAAPPPVEKTEPPAVEISAHLADPQSSAAMLAQLEEEPPPPAALAQPLPSPAPMAQFIVGSRRLRVAVIMGKMGSSVHGLVNVGQIWDDKSSFVTGTVAGFFGILWGLAEKGHQVDAFCDCAHTVVNAPNLGGANVYRIDDVGIDTTYDAYISINEPDQLRNRPAEKLKAVAMWLNDFSFCQPGFDNNVDVYACASRSLMDYLVTHAGAPRPKMTVVPLSVNPELHGHPLVRRPGSVVYASSPDRGLHHLLNMWSDIRARVPEANLKIFYRLVPWYESIMNGPGDAGSLMKERATQIWGRLNEFGRDGEQGVTVMGPVTPKKMAEELAAAKVLAYPCDPVRYTEGFSLTVMDACAAGCVPIVAAVDALTEVYWNAAHLIPGNAIEYRNEWIESIVLALTNEDFASEIRVSAKAHARAHMRQKVAVMWEDLIWERMKR